jgi:hypothetical protein
MRRRRRVSRARFKIEARRRSSTNRGRPKPDRVGLFLRGSKAEAPVVAAASRLLQGCDGDLAVLLLRPRTFDGLLLSAGLEPRQLRLDVEAEQRRVVRELVRGHCGAIRYSVTQVTLRSLRTALEAGVGEGWTSLVVPAPGWFSWRLRRAVAAADLTTIAVPTD